MLEAESIAKDYTTRAGTLPVLRDVNLCVEAGQSVAILGPSGSGKSTLLNILGTLETPTSGRVALDGTDPFALGERSLASFRNNRIGFVFQDHHLLPQCSVLENVLVPALVHPGNADAERRAELLLQRVGLVDRADHRPAELSGGEKQRVAVARALMNQPRLVLADEPTGNLDHATAERIGELLVDLPREENVILIVVTHSDELAACFDARYDLCEGTLRPR